MLSSRKALESILNDSSSSQQTSQISKKVFQLTSTSENEDDEIQEIQVESDKENFKPTPISKAKGTRESARRVKYTILSTDEDDHNDSCWTKSKKQKTTIKSNRKQPRSKKKESKPTSSRKRKKSDSFVITETEEEEDENSTDYDSEKSSSEQDDDQDGEWMNENKRKEKITFKKSSFTSKRKKKAKVNYREDNDLEGEETVLSDDNDDDDDLNGENEADDNNDDNYDNDDEEYNRKKPNQDEDSNESEPEVEVNENAKARKIDEEKFIFDLFNNGSLNEIKLMTESKSEKKINIIMDIRPFRDYEDLKSKTIKYGLFEYVNKTEKMLFARNKVNDLLEKCEIISSRMKRLENLTKHKYETDDLKVLKLGLKTQPKSLSKSMKLKPYQLVGLNWLIMMHEENLNGILADEMGLGKTCQTISFLAYLIEQQPAKMHLIIVPSSTLDNWSREIQSWLPSVNYRVYSGSLDERRRLRRDILKKRAKNPINIVLTTYSYVHSQQDDRNFFQRQLNLEYSVYDEAHMLKNMNTLRYKNLLETRSKRRLLLTGTPLQNNLIELISLLFFVMPDVFQRKSQYLKLLFKTRPADSDFDQFYNEKIEQAKGIMRPFILRRLKSEVLKDLPDKLENVIYCDMTEAQSNAYNDMVDFFKERVRQKQEKTLSKSSSKTSIITIDSHDSSMKEINNNNYLHEMFKKKFSKTRPNVMMELRVVANHPLLRRFIYTDDILKKMAQLIMKESPPETVYQFVLEDLSVLNDYEIHKTCPFYKGLKGFELDDSHIMASGKFFELEKLLAEKKQNGDRILLFSQFVIMLDIIEDFLNIKKYKYIRLDGGTAVSERQNLIDKYNKDKEIFIFLITTKAGGVGINLTSANVVILHDIDYNPFNDKQAQDRCHRVGQTREVEIYKLISKNSIEQLMLRIQEKKLELGSEISGEKMLKEELQQMNML